MPSASPTTRGRGPAVAEPPRDRREAADELERLAMLAPEGDDEPVLSPLPEGECALDGPRTRRESLLEHNGRLA